jgi:hypothetical protein
MLIWVNIVIFTCVVGEKYVLINIQLINSLMQSCLFGYINGNMLLVVCVFSLSKVQVDPL